MKALYVATVVKTHIMEFHIPYLKMLKEMGWETAVAAKNDYEDPKDCIIPYCDQYFNVPFERNPVKPGNIYAYRMLKKIIDEGDYDIIHCHTPVGAMLTRLAAQDARKKGTKVIYTAHGFHFYKGAPLVNWLVYYPVEKWLAPKTDVLITINKEDYERAKKKLHTGLVEYVQGVGINTKRFNKEIGNKEEKRRELGLKNDDFVLLSVGELIARKNHIVVLDALSTLKEKGEIEKIQYIICGRGNLSRDLMEKTEKLGLCDHVHFLGYRKDINEICLASDLFIFPSFQEGLPVALMEAMACGLPVICSEIRGSTDLIENGKNGEFVSNDGLSIAKKIIELKNCEDIRSCYSEEARKTVALFDINRIVETVKTIYEKALKTI